MSRNSGTTASIQTITSIPNDGYLTPGSAQDRVPQSIVNDISRQASVLGWTRRSRHQPPSEDDCFTCVAVREFSSIDIDYVLEPANVDLQVYEAILRLRDTAVLAIVSEVTDLAFDLVKPGQRYLLINSSGARIPIVESLDDVNVHLTSAARACLIRKQNVMLVWSEDVFSLVNIGQEVQEDLMGLIFNARQPRSTAFNSVAPSESGKSSGKSFSPVIRGDFDEKKDIFVRAIEIEEGPGEDDINALEAGALPPRREARQHTVKTSIAVLITVLAQFPGIAEIVREFAYDGSYLRFLYVIAIPVFICLSLFFFLAVVGAAWQLIVPLGVVNTNTVYHSAIKPKRSRHRDYELPHVTIQMPVYKEGLRGVIVPTMISLMEAIEYYEKAGGTASVFINDDGMQAIEPELAEARKQYYADNGIGYCARLPHFKDPSSQKKRRSFWSLFKKSKKTDAAEEIPTSNEPKERTRQDLANELGFVRKGKFKKASNMNYALSFSNRVEDELRRLQDLESRGGMVELSIDDDDRLYEQAMANMLAEDEGRTWAAGNIRVGEVILLIDCDTRVPVDCLLYGVLEMRESPELGILQHTSGIMQVANNYFEDGITHFTRIVYSAIAFSVGCGDVAPFVGHNAFLRWKAVQDCAFEEDGVLKYWSENTVSEDFDLSLRIQMHGMIIRLASYHQGGFKEGVSLTLYDELARWEKYAYGCNELVFHPFKYWIYKGPFTPLFRKYLFSNIRITTKICSIAYMSSYYAIACALILGVTNYFIIGLFQSEIDRYYLQGWNVFISVLFIFGCISMVSTALMRHKIKDETFWTALYNGVKWAPFLLMFFGGISLNCLKALLCHAFGINIEWSSTAKEVGPKGFYIGIERMVKSFKWHWAIVLILSAVMIYFSYFAPWGWTISPSTSNTAFLAIVPVATNMACSFLLPFFLGMN